MYIQQGDVILKQFDKNIPGEGKKISLLHKGQAHHHTLKGGAYLVYEGEQGKFLEVAEDTDLTHEEHKTIRIPSGKYKVEFVQEFDHFLQESRQVID